MDSKMLNASNDSLVDVVTNLYVKNQYNIAVAVAIVVVVISTLLLLLCRKSAKQNSVLLIGLCEAGKTLLFTRLIHNRYTSTHTSMKENSGLYHPPKEQKKSLQLVDLPGYEKLCFQVFDKYKSTARGIIFVIDSSTFQKDLKDVAELMYNVLSDKVILNNVRVMLVACNKHDHALAKGAKLIQSSLEKEINTLRRIKSSALENTDNSAKSYVFLGKANQDFTFADLKPLSVRFVECNAYDSKDEEQYSIGYVEQWLSDVA